jgi:hypothetical protein
MSYSYGELKNVPSGVGSAQRLVTSDTSVPSSAVTSSPRSAVYSLLKSGPVMRALIA